MKNILLLSDTHSYVDEQILKYVKQADEVWHAGDIGNISVLDTIKEIKPVRAVYGNVDDKTVRAEYPLDNKFEIEDITVWITHIGGYPDRYDKRVREDLKKERPTIFISGHSHILKVIFDKKLNILHLNPGAAGKHGFHQVRTMLRFSINKSKIENLEIIELGKRG